MTIFLIGKFLSFIYCCSIPTRRVGDGMRWGEGRGEERREDEAGWRVCGGRGRVRGRFGGEFPAVVYTFSLYLLCFRVVCLFTCKWLYAFAFVSLLFLFFSVQRFLFFLVCSNTDLFCVDAYNNICPLNNCFYQK